MMGLVMSELSLMPGYKRVCLRLALFFFIILSVVSCTSSVSIKEVKRQDSREKSVREKSLGPYERLEKKAENPSVVAYGEESDPLEFINRPIFNFNNILYRYLLTPLSKGYRKVTPDLVEQGIENLFSNLGEPFYFVNHLFQGSFKASGESLLRFILNSTVGVLGLFDVSNSWFNLERKKTSFAQTLASYGVGHGFYIMLPVLGPSDLRSGSSLAFNFFLHPLNYTFDDETGTYLLYFDGFQGSSELLSKYPEIVGQSKDPYLFIRNLHIQKIRRDEEYSTPQSGSSGKKP